MFSIYVCSLARAGSSTARAVTFENFHRLSDGILTFFSNCRPIRREICRPHDAAIAMDTEIWSMECFQLPKSNSYRLCDQVLLIPFSVPRINWCSHHNTLIIIDRFQYRRRWLSVPHLSVCVTDTAIHTNVMGDLLKAESTNNLNLPSILVSVV